MGFGPFLLFLLLLLLQLASTRTLPTCETKSEATMLLYLACLDHVDCSFLHDLGGPKAGADTGDRLHEMKRLANVAERLKLLQPFRARDHPVTSVTASFIWANTTLDSSYGILTYHSTRSAGHHRSPSDECHLLFDDAEARRDRLLPLVYQLVVERTMISGEPLCSDINMRLHVNPITGNAVCECQLGKQCGEQGARHQSIITLSIVFFLLLLVVVVFALLYSAITVIRLYVARGNEASQPGETLAYQWTPSK